MKSSTATLLMAGLFVITGCGEPVAPPIDQAPSTASQVIADPTIPVTACNATINQPGIYTLISDLIDCPPITGLAISGKLGGRVTLRLNGHRIAWTGLPDDIVGVSGLKIGSYVTVLGPGVVEGYWANLEIDGEHSHISGVLARYPQSWNALISNSLEVELDGNNFVGGPEEGMLVDHGSRNIVIARNEFLGQNNIAQTLRLKGVSGVEVRNNVFRGASIALSIEGGGNNLVVRNRVFAFNGTAILLDNSSGNQILRNTLRGNQSGVVAWGGGTNVVIGNTITDGGIGISMEQGDNGPTTGNRILRNSVLDNSTDLGDDQGCATQNIWLDNIFDTATSPCLH